MVFSELCYQKFWNAMFALLPRSHLVEQEAFQRDSFLFKDGPIPASFLYSFQQQTKIQFQRYKLKKA